MAQSPTHKFGQIIGDLLERTMEIPLRNYIDGNHRLYLDKKGPRPARGKKKKVLWTDKNGNIHDLDFVIEWDGMPQAMGSPAAFIEIAWRRYTKHSRNKAQEIQGAITPLFETYKNHCPFIGVILGGVFTEGSLTQLESLNFKILYFNYDTILQAFAVEGIDAFFDEESLDDVVQQRVEAYENLTPQQIQNIENRLLEIKSNEINEFINELDRTIKRTVNRIIIIPIHGNTHEVQDVDEAIDYIQNYEPGNDPLELIGFDIFVRYNNGDKIDARLQDKDRAVEFLNKFK